jgi:hypothetical protein
MTCNMRRKGMKDTLICDVGAWTQVKTLQLYLRKYDSLDTTNGVNISDIARGKTAAATALMEELTGAPLQRNLEAEEKRGLFALLVHRKQVIQQLTAINATFEAGASRSGSLPGAGGRTVRLCARRVDGRCGRRVERGGVRRSKSLEGATGVSVTCGA